MTSRRDSVALNVGCGGAYRAGYWNLDRARDASSDAVGDVRALPFADGVADDVVLIHLLEHLSYTDGLLALSEARRVLRPGGTLIIETPDAEASFARFVEERSPQQRAGLLSWIFGVDAPGYAHRLLWPWELLSRSLARAGFEEIRRASPRTHLYAPGLRVVARRGGLPVHAALGDLRRAIALSGLVDLSDGRDAPDFERRFIGTALALGGAPDTDGMDRDPRAAALELIWVAPEAARFWAGRCEALGVPLACDGAVLRLVAEAACEERLRERIFARFDRGFGETLTACDGFALLEGEAMEALRAAWARPGEARAAIRSFSEPRSASDTTGPTTSQTTSQTTGRAPLVRSFFAREALRWHDAGVRALSLGRLDEAQRLLGRAAAARVDPLYPYWNLAIAQALAGDLVAATESYEAALDLAPEAVAATIERELALCYLLSGAQWRAEALVATLPSDAVLRRRPVLSGEGIHHAPSDADPA